VARSGILLITVALVVGITGCVQPIGSQVTSADPDIEAAVREAIAKLTGTIYPSALDGLTFLNATQKSIGNLTGLECCTSLTNLNLWHNQISDVCPSLQNGGLGTHDLVDLTSNPLSSNSINIYASASGDGCGCFLVTLGRSNQLVGKRRNRQLQLRYVLEMMSSPASCVSGPTFLRWLVRRVKLGVLQSSQWAWYNSTSSHSSYKDADVATNSSSKGSLSPYSTQFCAQVKLMARPAFVDVYR